jgi:hypothetical protein
LIHVKSELVWKEIIARLKTPMQALKNKLIIIKDANQQDYSEGIFTYVRCIKQKFPKTKNKKKNLVD